MLNELTKEARKYLLGRGITKESIEEFEIGFDNNPISTFRGRIIVPIFDHVGNKKGFQGRLITVESKKVPKYLFSKGFLKSEYLYGLINCKEQIIRDGVVVLTEGTLNAIIGQQMGLPVVAKLGTGISTAQLTLLSRYAHLVIVVEDNDEPGILDTKNTVEALKDWGFQTKVLSFGNFKEINDFNDYYLKGDHAKLRTHWEKLKKCTYGTETTIGKILKTHS